MATSLKIKVVLIRELLSSTSYYKKVEEAMIKIGEIINKEGFEILNEDEKWIVENMPSLYARQEPIQYLNLWAQHPDMSWSKLDKYRELKLFEGKKVDNLSPDLPYLIGTGYGYHPGLTVWAVRDEDGKPERFRRVDKMIIDIMGEEVFPNLDRLVKAQKALDEFFEKYSLREIKFKSPKIYKIYEATYKTTKESETD